MTDREKVIEGLEMSFRYSNVDESNTLVPQQLVLDALALLKAQEPRVMADTELEAIRKAPLILKPNVDAVPVVRCADCKYCFDIGSDPMEPYDGESEWYCERFDRDTSAYEIDPYRFFCADGERRRGEYWASI